MTTQPSAGNQIARYFERVLGVRRVTPFEIVGPMPIGPAPVCLLIEVGEASSQPSLQQMGARMLEAIRNEWLKRSSDHIPQFEWCQAGGSDWELAIQDFDSNLTLAIVCGAETSGSPAMNRADLKGRIVHVASFSEMQGSPVVKRDSWVAMQKKIAERAVSHEID